MNRLHTAALQGDAPDGLRKEFFSHVPDRLWNDWRWQMRSRVRTVEQLAQYLPLSHEQQEQLSFVTAKYPLSITPHYLCLINPDDPFDPIRRQAVPALEETALCGFGDEDPLAEAELSPVPGLVHRYPDRALIITNNICPVHVPPLQPQAPVAAGALYTDRRGPCAHAGLY